MEDKFSWKRLGLLARAEWTSQRRAWLLQIGGLVLFSSLVFLLQNMHVLLEPSQPYSTRLLIFFGVGWVVFLNISLSFKNYRARGSAVMQTMLPASKSEKFLYATLKSIVVVPVVIVVILSLMDVIWAAILGFDNVFMLAAKLWDEWVSISLETIQITVRSGIMFVCGSLSSMTFFLLGAVLFRRHQFLFTLLVSYGSYIVGVGIFQMRSVFGTQWIDNVVFGMTNTVGFWINISLTTASALLWLYLAWRHFRKLSVVQ